MSYSGVLSLCLSVGKKAQSPWFGVGLRRSIFSGGTGFGNGYLDAPNLNLGPVRWIADTPRDLFKSRSAETAVDEKLEDCTGGWTRGKWRDGAR